MAKLSRQRGFALVLVLITLLLVATMVVLFLSSTGRERRGVDLYARGSQVRHLASMTVSRVMGQINAATKEGTAATPVSWASQPGMIRTYGATGDARNVYKLYSWDDLVMTGSSFKPNASAEMPPSDWKSAPVLFTDLNQAINDVYPIVDPRAEGAVEGFSIDPAGAAVAGSGLPAPMPVKWLYVLQDGQIVAPASVNGSTATIPGATKDNPIVGRVAFWTDDETSKVNVNTASEGAYWDWPKAATYDEMQFAGNPPVAGEYNRTPGHPAMTSLSAVFPELDPGARWSNVASYRTKLEQLLSLTPRVRYAEASSRGGTYPIDSATYNYGPTGSLPAIPNAPLTMKSDRLLVSPDETIFQYPARGLQAALTPEMLQRRAFFLTAQSRAPETTLFETPRVSLWPVTWPYPSAHASLANRQTASASAMNPDSAKIADNPWMRAEERLLAFVSTLNRPRADGGDKYYFQRQNPESPTADYTAIRRNRELLAYLQNLTGADVPGYGGNFAAAYGAATRDAVLANSFNVVRSLVNQYTLQNDGKMLYSFTPVAFTKFTRPNGTVAANYVESGAFCPIPMKLDLGSGEVVTVSEFPVLREAALVFYATQRVDPVPPNIGAASGTAANKIQSNPRNWQNLINLDSTNGYPVGARTTQMRAVMLLDFAPLRGSTRNNNPVFWVKVTGGNLQAAGQNLGLSSAVAKMDFRAVSGGRSLPGYLLPLFQKNAAGIPSGVKTFINGNVSDTNYGLVSLPVTVPQDATTFSFSGAPLTIEVYGIKDGNPDLDPTSDSSLLLGSSTVDFAQWNGDQGIPLAPRWNYYELKSETPQHFPNPNFKATDPSVQPTKWAAWEIAPPYKSGASSVDPAILPATYSSVTPFTTLYRNQADGSLIVPANTTGLGVAVAYAKRDANGELMTDYARRLSFMCDTGITQASTADNGGFGGALNSKKFVYSYEAGYPAITVYDTVISMIADPDGAGKGDPRLGRKFEFVRSDHAFGSDPIAQPPPPLRKILPDTDYPQRINKQYHTLGAANQSPANTGYITTKTYSMLGNALAPDGMAQEGATSISGKLGGLGGSPSDADAVGVNSARPQSVVAANGSVGDWSSQPGYISDGGVVQRADQDFQALSLGSNIGGFTYQTPYFRQTNSLSDGLETALTKGYFSPNRQIASPIGLFGALPTSLSIGWQSLLFSPNPAAGSSHPGLANNDFLYLDLFWMPVAEPYPISEQFSTAGKVNLNYQIAPFSYLKRRTALHALMKSTWITALNNSLARDYKSHDIVKGEANAQTRYPIDAEETIKGFDQAVFDSGDLFRSAAQICRMWLVPQGSTEANVQSFWNDKLLTSDTAREEPYNNLYSRVTTKSNTFTVHWRAQVLRKSPAGDAGTWDETRDRVASDLRGATLIERYLDPNATNIPDYATDTSAIPLSHYYKWRVVSENFFQP